MFKRFPFIHNHGDFVHLDALRDWLRGVPSLDTFLKYQNDKAIVKDMHFTDEKTTVEYIDTTDDRQKEATLCEYLTSDVYDGDDKTVFNKVKKIRFSKDDLNENYIDVTEKNNGKERNSVIKSYVPAVYPSDSTKKYSDVTSKCSHFGFSPYGIYLYNDKDLTVTQKYQFSRLIAYPAGEKYGESPTTDLISNVGVGDDGVYLYHQDKTLYKKIPFTQGLIYPAKETYTTEDTAVFHKIGLDDHGITLYSDDDNSEVRRISFSSGGSGDYVNTTDLPSVDPFGSVTDTTNGTELQLHKHSNFHATVINNTVISGQIDYALSGDLHIEPGKYVVLELNPGSIEGSGLGFSNVYPKYAQIENNTKGLITQITSVGGYPVTGTGSPTFLTIYNQTDDNVAVENLHFTF